MPAHKLRGRYLALLVAGLLLASTIAISTRTFAAPATPTGHSSAKATASFPVVDPDYIYNQLFYMSTHYLHREAGYDKNLPPTSNGHDEFAAYWSNEMLKNFQGFGARSTRDTFSIKGWPGRPAVVPAFNQEVTIPGVTHPEQVVTIGCHYDGMFNSTQSAYDDASGCAIELGVAKSLGTYWRANHVYPARTLRFVIFDAEEQGIFGSFHYINNTVNGDINNIVDMFNEEQNGIAYPLRYKGQTSNPLLPLEIFMSPLTDNNLYPHQDKLTPQQRAAITHFRSLMGQAVPAVFAQFQAMGYTQLTYHNGTKNVIQPIFTPDQTKNLLQEDDTLGSSDQMAFTLAGLPCATIAGNHSYYDPNPPPWSYPYDQPQDKIQLMNTFANGNQQKAEALVLALAIPGMLTTWMLHQPDILGEVASDHNPIAAISDIGQTVVNTSIPLNAKASYDPDNASSKLSYAWNFGDGATATGISTSHTYTKTGNYTLTLTVSSPTDKRTISKVIQVVTQAPQYPNPFG